MSKDYLEALERLVCCDEDIGYTSKYVERDFNIVKQALQRLEAIDNANPSEVLEDLKKLRGMEISAMPFKDDCGIQEVDLNDIRKVGSQLNTDFRKYTDTIAQALLKAQEQEKVLNVIFEKNVDIELIKLYKNYKDYCISKEKYLLRKDLWLTEEEFELLKKYADKGE